MEVLFRPKKNRWGRALCTNCPIRKVGPAAKYSEMKLLILKLINKLYKINIYIV